MNAIIREEFDKLNDLEKEKFLELDALQRAGNPGQPSISFSAQEQILKWVKAMNLCTESPATEKTP